MKLQQTYQRLGHLYPVINEHTTHRPHCTFFPYETVLRPILTVGWLGVVKKQMYKLQVFQNKVLHTTVNAPCFVRKDKLHEDLTCKANLSSVPAPEQ